MSGFGHHFNVPIGQGLVAAVVPLPPQELDHAVAAAFHLNGGHVPGLAAVIGQPLLVGGGEGAAQGVGLMVILRIRVGLGGVLVDVVLGSRVKVGAALHLCHHGIGFSRGGVHGSLGLLLGGLYGVAVFVRGGLRDVSIDVTIPVFVGVQRGGILLIVGLQVLVGVGEGVAL